MDVDNGLACRRVLRGKRLLLLRVDEFAVDEEASGNGNGTLAGCDLLDWWAELVSLSSGICRLVAYLDMLLKCDEQDVA